MEIHRDFDIETAARLRTRLLHLARRHADLAAAIAALRTRCSPMSTSC